MRLSHGGGVAQSYAEFINQKAEGRQNAMDVAIVGHWRHARNSYLFSARASKGYEGIDFTRRALNCSCVAILAGASNTFAPAIFCLGLVDALRPYATTPVVINTQI